MQAGEGKEKGEGERERRQQLDMRITLDNYRINKTDYFLTQGRYKSIPVYTTES